MWTIIAGGSLVVGKETKETMFLDTIQMPYNLGIVITVIGFVSSRNLDLCAVCLFPHIYYQNK